MKITFISDTHNKNISKLLPGGDMLIHAGDISGRGLYHEIENFLVWFNSVDYKHKIFIAGNHDWEFQRYPEEIRDILGDFPDIIYLQDNSVVIDGVNIYGSPWQPWFLDWAFNLPRDGKELMEKWNKIPEDTDILITHGSPYGYLDKVMGQGKHHGCKLLAERIETIKPKIHVYGHIHSGNGYVYNGDTHFINASVLDENYIYRYKPFTIDWDKNTKELF
jgi:Icc-related predicted phosphoesterase